MSVSKEVPAPSVATRTPQSVGPRGRPCAGGRRGATDRGQPSLTRSLNLDPSRRKGDSVSIQGGQGRFDASMGAKWPGRGHTGTLAWLVEGLEGSEASHR